MTRTVRDIIQGKRVQKIPGLGNPTGTSEIFIQDEKKREGDMEEILFFFFTILCFVFFFCYDPLSNKNNVFP